jgi:hypothetical protein
VAFFIALAVIVSKAWPWRSVITNGGMDLQLFGAEVAGVGGHSKAAKIFPLTRKAHSEASDVPLFLVALEERFVDFLLQWGRFGDDRRKIVEGQSLKLNKLAGIERHRAVLQCWQPNIIRSRVNREVQARF